VEFFGLGFGEIVLVIIIALIIFGPEKVPEMARSLGKMMRTIRQATSGFTNAVTQEVDEVKKTASDLTAPITQEINEVKKTTSDITQEVDKVGKTTSDFSAAIAQEVGAVKETTSEFSTTVNRELGKVEKTTSDFSTAVVQEVGTVASKVEKTTSDVSATVVQEVEEARKSPLPPSQSSSDTEPRKSADTSTKSGGAAETSPVDRQDISGKNGKQRQ
jgi:Tat protein translocase TatB subunit